MTDGRPSRLWMIWACVPYLSGIAFIIGGRRARSKRWEWGGWLSLVPSVVTFALRDAHAPGTDAFDIAIGVVIALWIGAMFAVFWLRHLVEAKAPQIPSQPRRVASPVADRSPFDEPPAPAADRLPPPPTSAARRNPAGAAEPAHRRPPAAPPPPRSSSELLEDQTDDVLAGAGLSGEPVDVNSADVTELAALPGVSVAMAQRAIGYREAKGGFSDLADFLSAIGVQPHEATALRARVTVGQAREARSDGGRLLDL